MPNLSIIPAGRLDILPTDILDHERIANFFQELKFYFDQVIVDTPPVIPVSDPMLIAETAGATGKSVYVPGPDRTRFEFVSTTSGAPGLTAGSEDVLFVVPGVAFDERGGRLGRGDGWYDRALALHALHPRLGLAYEFQLVPTLPQATWDIRMHAVVTEERVVGGLPKEKHR